MSNEALEHFHVVVREALDRRGLEQVCVELHRSGESVRVCPRTPARDRTLTYRSPGRDRGETRPGRAGRPPAARCSGGRTSPGIAENGWHHAGGRARGSGSPAGSPGSRMPRGPPRARGPGIHARSDSRIGRRGVRACSRSSRATARSPAWSGWRPASRRRSRPGRSTGQGGVERPPAKS